LIERERERDDRSKDRGQREGLTLKRERRERKRGSRESGGKRAYRSLSLIPFSSSEREIVKGIKEAACYVALDPNQEEESLENAERNKAMQVQYKLPDGKGERQSDREREREKRKKERERREK
jgi:hypothetical protein